MIPRDARQPHRVASSLELFFDLVFVVAVSNASAQLHHAFSAGHVLHGLTSFAMLFFAIWWAWMNFAWFATAFDTDDWLYRVTTIVQMGGVLVLAAGIPDAFEHGRYGIVVAGYVVMRIAMVAQWLRASRGAGRLRRATLRYAAGIAGVQVLWVLFLLLPAGAVQIVAFVVFALMEMSVPIVAEREVRTPWHPHHITERYGLFTLIVLGESLLASANAIIDALHEAESFLPFLSISVLTLVVTAALWWIYFWPEHHTAVGSFGRSLRYGYLHYFVFAAAAAFSSGIETELDVLTGDSALSSTAASFTVTVPIAVFLLCVWWLVIRPVGDRVIDIVVPGGAVLVLLDPVLPVPVALTAGIVAAIVVVLVVRGSVARPGR
ncbi:low temperature requirement protein A [uncultured Microbacterium sp.]|uniref:low temperature requirement protein A n=1 Tax=uncultured Microbacterium sp. TaxID=191216 RepID=UPI0037DD7504